MITSGDIFSALAKYSSAVDENYLTETFIFLLNTLIMREPPASCELFTTLRCKSLIPFNQGVTGSRPIGPRFGTPNYPKTNKRNIYEINYNLNLK